MMISYFDGAQESNDARFARLLPILVCPRCSGGLLQRLSNLTCSGCEVVYPIRSGVPILLPSGVNDVGAATVSENDPVSRHPYSSSASEIIASHANGLVLDLGAGGKFDRYFNVIQVDIFRYPAVDVVASADRLPFADNSFDAVVSQAVFEHLQYPEWAAAEIRRVLKVGGVAKIDTAFLQPEHGYPHHFFNATETGLRHWFRDFDIKWSGVEPFQQPKWALHWFLGLYLDYIGTSHARALRVLSVGDLIEVLQRHADGVSLESDTSAISALDSIPERFVRVLAAGVSVNAVNRAKDSSGSVSQVVRSPVAVDREREMELLRIEQLEMQARSDDLHSRFDILRDQTDFLLQFAPDVDHKTVSLADVFGLSGAYLDNIKEGPYLGGRAERPFASIITAPTNGARLLDSFFSLTGQVYGGWEFVVVLSKSIRPTLGGLAARLAKLDSRVRVISSNDEQDVISYARGEFSLLLRDGATFAAHALEEVVTAARFTAGVAGVSFDYERSSQYGPLAIRCHAQVPGASTDPSACFLKIGCSQVVTGELSNVSHIALPLMRLPGEREVTISPLKAQLRLMVEQNIESNKLMAEARADNESAASEWRQLADDSSNYLSQLSTETRSASGLHLRTELRRSIARILRNNLPIKYWRLLQNLRSGRRFANGVHTPVSAVQPFATFVLEPTSATGLIHTFFSLVHQTYSGWQLILIENHDQSAAIRRGIFDFKRLDSRITVVNGANPSTKLADIGTVTSGRYVLSLDDGVTLRFQCLEQVVALVRDNPVVAQVACDYQCVRLKMPGSMRCYNQSLPTTVIEEGATFDGVFKQSDALDHVQRAAESEDRIAHIPRVLFSVFEWSQ